MLEQIENLKKLVTANSNLLIPQELTETKALLSELEIPNSSENNISITEFDLTEKIELLRKKAEENRNPDLVKLCKNLICFFFLDAAEHAINGIKSQQYINNAQEESMNWIAQLFISTNLNYQAFLKTPEMCAKAKAIKIFIKDSHKKTNDASQRINLEELSTIIENKKNTRLETMPIVQKESIILYGIDEGNLIILLENILALINSSQKRKQFIFFSHEATSHSQLLDVEWDAVNNRFLILSLDSSPLEDQYHVLKFLSDSLTERNIVFQVIACQTCLQRDYISCAVYAYFFANQISKICFADLENKKLFVSQPAFKAFIDDGKYLDFISLPSPIRWLDPKALSPEIILSTQSRERVKELSPTLYARSLTEQTEFITRKTAGMKEKADLYKKSTSELLVFFKTTDPGQALRRCATGHGSVNKLKVLLKKFPDKINDQDQNPKGKNTPLHCALKSKQAKHAELLKKYGALTNLQNADQITADMLMSKK